MIGDLLLDQRARQLRLEADPDVATIIADPLLLIDLPTKVRGLVGGGNAVTVTRGGDLQSRLADGLLR
jgi:hypothetical protein